VTSKAPCILPFAVVAAMAAVPTPARADFFDDARKTFTTDIPHFFQDDIPCAFGGEPTSHTKGSCDSGEKTAKPRAVAPVPEPEPPPTETVPPPVTNPPPALQ